MGLYAAHTEKDAANHRALRAEHRELEKKYQELERETKKLRKSSAVGLDKVIPALRPLLQGRDFFYDSQIAQLKSERDDYRDRLADTLELNEKQREAFLLAKPPQQPLSLDTFLATFRDSLTSSESSAKLKTC